MCLERQKFFRSNACQLMSKGKCQKYSGIGANDLKKINSSLNIFVFADKTRNIYETSLNFQWRT
jgi:hypothetical protein